MKLLFTTLKSILVILVLLVIIAFFLPSTIRVEKSIRIQGSVENAYQLVNDYRAWNKWCPWNRMDPNWKVTYGDTVVGLGANYSWESKHEKVGNGRMRIIETIPNEKVRSEMFFMNSDQPAYSDMIFMPEDSISFSAHWSIEFEAGMNPMVRWMGLFMDKMMGSYFDEGLALLKSECEKMPVIDHSKIAGFDFEWRDIAAKNIAGVRAFVKYTELGPALYGSGFATIGAEMKKQKLTMVGAPMCIYHTFKNDGTDMEISVPVSKLGKNEGKVQFHTLEPCKAMVIKYYGSYEKTEPVFNAAYDYLKQNGMNTGAAPMEVYMTDPGLEKDTAKWLTEIIFPLQ